MLERVRTPTWRVATLLFGSGCCALVYQIGWLREFRMIFGASTAASAAVLAIFIGGLGFGGLLLGPRADRHPRPILFYSQLESIVAVSAAVSPFLLALARQLYIAAGGTPRLGIVAGTVGRLALSALVLAVPTLVMGGTLPAAARGVTRATDARRRDVAALYGLNTLGAVAGCLVATFYLLELFGTRATLWLSAAVNLLIAVLARQLDRSLPPSGDDRAAEAAEGAAGAADRSHAPARFVLIASGVVGFAFFLMEIVWYRMLGPLLGGSVFTFGLVLAIALVGIGVGGLLYALVGSEQPASLSAFALSCLLEAAAIAVGYAFGDRLAVLALVLTPLGQAGFGARIATWCLVTAIVVLPPALVAGYQFPLLVALFGRGRARVGREIGLVYATNTVGAIAGSLAGGFGLLPWLSAPGTWRLASVVLVALGTAAAWLEARRGNRRGLAAQAVVAVAALAMLAAGGPTAVWRHSGIGAGRAALPTPTPPNQIRDWAHRMRRVMMWEGDGTESSVALIAQSSGYAFIVNGKSDGSARADAATQVMLGLLGAIVNPHARRSLVVGLGTGSSAGWLGAIPAMERVDVVELEPLVLEVARACAAVNRNVLDNPKVRIRLGDAREYLLTGADQYDVIASEPSNPFRAGVASLFTREYYGAASSRLTADGVFVQWVQAYEIDTRTLRTIYATMGTVFPYVETWQLGMGDLALVGAKHPPAYSATDLAARIHEEPFRSALRVAWRAADLHGLLAHYLAGDALTRAIVKLPMVNVNTDDRNIVEFGFARSVGRDPALLDADVRRLAGALGAGRPPLPPADRAAINWPAVDTAWVGFHAAEGSSANVLNGLTADGPSQADEQARRTALVDYYKNGNYASARQRWPAQGDPPRDPTELSMVADLHAEAGAETALTFLDRLRVYEPSEADTLLAGLRARQGRYGEAAAALESALRQFRTDPWAPTRIKTKAMDIIWQLAPLSPPAARRLFAALGEPFAVGVLEDDRRITRAALTRAVDFRGLCRQEAAALEPHIPWNQEFLTFRRDCYQALGDPRLASATRDLVDFLSDEPLPLAAGINPTATR